MILWYKNNNIKQVYIEKKKHPYSVIMANFMMPETHQPFIVISLIIYSVYLLKNLGELEEYISGRIASCLFQFLRKLHSFLSAGL